MDEELTKPVPEACSYCGGKVDARLYFCPCCAKPFRAVEEVISAPPTPYEDDEMRLRVGAQSAWNTFFIYLIAMAISWFIAASIWGVEDSEPVFIVTSAAIGVTTLVLTVYYWRNIQVQLNNVFALFHPWSWAGFGILVPLLFLNYFYHGLLTGWLDVESEDFRDYFSSNLGAVIIVCVMPAITEEIAFRGIIQNQFEKVVRPSVAIGVAAVVFSAAHFSVLSAPYLALVGVLLGWMKWKTGSLYPPMVAHFLHNYIVITHF